MERVVFTAVIMDRDMADEHRVDLSSYTVPELEELARDIGQGIAKKRAKYRRSLPLVEGSGPVYRNPANACETWCGRGEPPAWFKHALARGDSPETLLI